MKILYIDCFSGISGDMFLGALLDLGVPLDVFEEVIEQLGIPVVIQKITAHQKGLRATRAILKETSAQPEERSYSELKHIVRSSKLRPEIAERVEHALCRLAEAEAAAHGTPLESVHFHELGGLDTLVDLAGAFAGVAHLGVERVFASPLPLARGTAITKHGAIPLPAPATLHLLKGVPSYGVPFEGELVTPTGAVIVTAIADSFGPPPSARWTGYGYGSGAMELPQPNILRLWYGEGYGDAAERGDHHLLFDRDRVVVIETQVDDCNPEYLSHLRLLLERLGALDVTFTPTTMKKGRPGVIIAVLAYPEMMHKLAETLFRETTAIGLRWYTADRIKLYRQSAAVETPFGKVSVKLGYALRPDGSREYLNIAPEYEECAARAEETGRSIKEVYQAALRGAARLADDGR
ncbi:MAG: nickel pincer cofactor biosynthesis protein LarC [Thermacetogeniaceae bacterium]